MLTRSPPFTGLLPGHFFKLALFLVTIFYLFSVAACSEPPSHDKKAGRKKPAHLVETVIVQHANLDIEKTRNGTLRALREVKIFNQEEGRIVALPFYPGDSVKRGELIVRLDDKLLRSQLARASATRLKAEEDLRRIKDLSKKRLVPDEELNRAQTDLEVAKADEDVLITRLGYTTIKSPINGVITERLSEPGNIAERYTHLLTISDPTSLVTDVTVSELLINKLTQNQKVQVSIDALGGKTYPGRISRIYPNLDPVTRRGTVEVELKPVPNGASPGQLCRVKLRLRAEQGLSIPFKALRRDLQGEYVYIVDGESKVKRMPIVSGMRVGEQVEILEGLQPAQQVVIKGFLDLSEGKKVSIVGAAGTASADKEPALSQQHSSQ
jgi:membrane fusion protein (multidrug efflux system)